MGMSFLLGIWKTGLQYKQLENKKDADEQRLKREEEKSWVSHMQENHRQDRRWNMDIFNCTLSRISILLHLFYYVFVMQ